MLPDELEGFLILCRRGILQPEQPVRFEIAREPRSFDRRQSMMHVVQQFDVEAMFTPQALEQLWHEREVRRRCPYGFDGQLAFRGLVRILQTRDAVRLLDPGYATLRAHGLVALGDVLAHFRAALVDVLAIRMAVHEYAVARTTAEQSIERQARHLAENVPQRHVDSGERGHLHRSATPVRAAIEKLPDVLDAPRVAADEIRHHVVLQIRSDGEFPAIQSRVANAGNTGARDDLQ